jgi:two-component system response regulator ChvI
VSNIERLDKLRQQTAGVPIVLLSSTAWPAREDVVALEKAPSTSHEARRFWPDASSTPPRLWGVHPPPQTDGMLCGKLLLRAHISRACWMDADRGLTLGEYNILHLLVSNVGRYVTYRAIYDRLHYKGFIAGEGADGYRANVRSAIKRIRKSSAAWTRPSTRSKTTTVSAPAGRSQTNRLVARP